MAETGIGVWVGVLVMVGVSVDVRDCVGVGVMVGVGVVVLVGVIVAVGSLDVVMFRHQPPVQFRSSDGTVAIQVMHFIQRLIIGLIFSPATNIRSNVPHVIQSVSIHSSMLARCVLPVNGQLKQLIGLSHPILRLHF